MPKDNKNNLEMDSIVKSDVLSKIENKEIVMKIGRVDDDKIEEYKETYLNIIKNNKYNKKNLIFLLKYSKIINVNYLILSYKSNTNFSSV